MESLAFIPVGDRPLALDVKALANRVVRLDVSEPSTVLACMVSQSSLFERIKAHQYDDPHLHVLNNTVQNSDTKEVIIGDDAVFKIQGWICVPNMDGLQELILADTHSSRCSIHQGTVKIYHDLKHHNWWTRMTKDIVEYVARCLNCQQVTYER
ncbi:uncharacterized protein [Nicotiana tomentosiformis]|uniref:uncharacterized protein n=1 Tax=Nicotiana tomentosiformis TaxID=4098 RepID=UPI00388C932F